MMTEDVFVTNRANQNIKVINMVKAVHKYEDEIFGTLHDTPAEAIEAENESVHIHHAHPLIVDYRSLVTRLVSRMYADNMGTGEISRRLRIEWTLVDGVIECCIGDK